MDYGAITYYQAQLKGAVCVITEAHVCHVSLSPTATLRKLLLGWSYCYHYNTPYSIISSRDVFEAMREEDLPLEHTK